MWAMDCSQDQNEEEEGDGDGDGGCGGDGEYLGRARGYRWVLVGNWVCVSYNRFG